RRGAFMIKRLVAAIVDVAGKWPWLVFACVMATGVASWWYASHLDLRSELLELLPRDSPGFKAFEHQLGRTGGGAPLIIVNESPDRRANERFIDDLSARLNKVLEERKKCVEERRPNCGPELISYLETGTKEVRKFFDDNKWLYAD